MANQSAGLSELWRLLDDLEDLLKGGYRRPHPGPPRLGLAPPPPPEPDPGDRGRRLAALNAEVLACTRCPLHRGRTQAVPGTGVLDPLVMVVGEGPGADEDRQGLPFVGAAGKYLDRWLTSVDLSRETNAYIANIVKCRPPNNRDPQPEEMSACLPYLEEQVRLVRPRVLLTVGRIALGALTGSSGGISRVHGTWMEYRGIPLLPTFHPSAVLRDEALRRPVWEDLKKLRAYLDTHA